MFFDMPPAPPAIVVKEECKKNDRSCFPEDRVPVVMDLKKLCNPENPCRIAVDDKEDKSDRGSGRVNNQDN